MNRAPDPAPPLPLAHSRPSDWHLPSLLRETRLCLELRHWQPAGLIGGSKLPPTSFCQCTLVAKDQVLTTALSDGQAAISPDSVALSGA